MIAWLLVGSWTRWGRITAPHALLNSGRGNCALCRLFFPVSQPAVACTGEWLIHALWPSACKTSSVIILICPSLLFAVVMKSEVHRWVWNAAVLGSACAGIGSGCPGGWGMMQTESRGILGLRCAPCCMPQCCCASLLLSSSPGCSPVPRDASTPRGSCADTTSLCFPGLPRAASHTRELRGVLPPALFHRLPQLWEGIILCLTR